MATFNILYSYLMYLLHPLMSHDVLSGKTIDEDLGIKKISLYEALGTSWLFVVFNGLFRILMINFVIIIFYKFTSVSDGLLFQLAQSENTSGFYFLVLSTILDIIFFPVLTLIIVHFWEFIISAYAKLLGIEDNVSEHARNIMTVSLSSNLLLIVPIIGDLAQKIMSIILLFVGLKKQFGMSFSIGVCIFLTPFLMLMGVFSLVMLFVLVSVL